MKLTIETAVSNSEKIYHNGENWYKHGTEFMLDDTNNGIAVCWDDTDRKMGVFNIIVYSDARNNFEEKEKTEQWCKHLGNGYCLWGHTHNIKGKLTYRKIKDYIFNSFIPRYNIEIE